VVLKDKPILAPFRVLQPTWFASSLRFPFHWAFEWWLATQALAWLEPVPDELQIQFDWKYLASVHLCAIAGQLLLPLLAWFLIPGDVPSGRGPTLVRLSMGASLWFLWTFPLTFLFTGSQGALVLSLGRELLWAGALAIGIASLRSRKPVRQALLVGTWSVFFFLGALVFAALPDLDSLSRMRMDDLGTGRVCKGLPRLPPHRVESATWMVWGDPKIVSVSRLSLGTRQTVQEEGRGRVLVKISAGAPPPPEDTVGTNRIDPTDGSLLESLVRSVPRTGPDSLRLVRLHDAVHRSIRYERRYFPGTSSEILSRGSGDCKAYAQVFCAGARRLGFPARVVHGLLASPDGYYAHAWVTVKTSSGWQDWDPTSSEPFPDARYLRFATPKLSSGAFDGELAIFALDSISVLDAGK
jgi:hypothetical protein